VPAYAIFGICFGNAEMHPKRKRRGVRGIGRQHSVARKPLWQRGFLRGPETLDGWSSCANSSQEAEEG
jgi:hypothetical protein